MKNPLSICLIAIMFLEAWKYLNQILSKQLINYFSDKILVATKMETEDLFMRQ